MNGFVQRPQRRGGPPFRWARKVREAWRKGVTGSFDPPVAPPRRQARKSPNDMTLRGRLPSLARRLLLPRAILVRSVAEMSEFRHQLVPEAGGARRRIA